MTGFMLQSIKIREDILKDEKYAYLFSVEEVNKLVLQGVPFRDAYVQVGKAIEAGTFNYSTEIHHTHEGSIGNLGNIEIQRNFKNVVGKFGFEKIEKKICNLIDSNSK
jgi:argininosuccinate lyase